MTNNSIAILMVAMILFCSLSGCIDGSSEKLESDISELQNENEQLKMKNEK